MGKWSKIIYVFFGVLFLSATMNAFVQSYKYNPSYRNVSIPLDKTTDLYKTVAHLDLSGVEDLELVYKDVDADVAYYRYVGDKDILKEGDVVTTYEGVESKVVAIDVQGFYLEYSDMFYRGMSGTSIFNSDGEVVGYVSKIIEDSRVFCIWK